MEQGYEKRMLIVFLISFLILIGYMYFMPKYSRQNILQNTNSTVVNSPTITNIVENESAVIVTNSVKFVFKVPATNIDLSYSNEMQLRIDSIGARISGISINGKWNRKNTPVQLISPDLAFKPGDTGFGNLQNQRNISERPFFIIKDTNSVSVTMIADIDVKSNRIEMTKAYTISSNYQFKEEIAVKNLSKKTVKLDFNGKSFSVGTSYSFITKELANSGNPLTAQYFDGKNLHRALSSGFLKARDRFTTVNNPPWLCLNDNYFISIMKPEFTDYSGVFVLVKEEKIFSEEAYGIEIPAITLDPGESKSFRISYYAGPKKESILQNIDKSYKIIFAWAPYFNWFMKPIEWVMYKVMSLLSAFISNWGIIIIILSLLIKLLLSPLSFQAAISIKRSNIIQPKIKALQEKYKDDQKTLNEKIAELYKKEGVNPLGGCFPILFQVPVFFALYRVLSTSVELKDATFLWIRDLTQPDTLFKMSIPFLPNNFNLLPIIMTIIQLIQMKLSSMKTTANPQQNAMNTYLLPIVFLFIFWGMPSGLVLYWTIQNVYSIIEQEFVNMDRQIKLKKK